MSGESSLAIRRLIVALKDKGIKPLKEKLLTTSFFFSIKWLEVVRKGKGVDV